MVVCSFRCICHCQVLPVTTRVLGANCQWSVVARDRGPTSSASKHPGLQLHFWDPSLHLAAAAGAATVRLAVVPMSQEARGLDAGQRLATRLVGTGDNRSASIVNRIAEEERAHVAVGELPGCCWAAVVLGSKIATTKGEAKWYGTGCHKRAILWTPRGTRG